MENTENSKIPETVEVGDYVFKGIPAHKNHKEMQVVKVNVDLVNHDAFRALWGEHQKLLEALEKNLEKMKSIVMVPQVTLSEP